MNRKKQSESEKHSDQWPQISSSGDKGAGGLSG